MSFPPPPPAQPHMTAPGMAPGFQVPNSAPYPPPPGANYQPYSQQATGQYYALTGVPTYIPFNQPYGSAADQQSAYGAGPPVYNNESNDFAAPGFTDKKIRRKFIGKVYAILSVQLMVTMAFVAVFLLVTPVRKWVRANQWFYWLSYGVFIVTYFALACCVNVRRRFPGNFIALGIFTLAFSYIAGTISSFYGINSVLVCLGITVGVTVTVSFAAICCPCDITKCQAVIAFISVLFFIFGIVCTIVYLVSGEVNQTLHAVYGGIAAIVFSIYLAYDTKMVIGGGKYELSPEDYIFGALQLYVDVVNIFLALLTIFGYSD